MINSAFDLLFFGLMSLLLTQLNILVGIFIIKVMNEAKREKEEREVIEVYGQDNIFELFVGENNE